MKDCHNCKMKRGGVIRYATLNKNLITLQNICKDCKDSLVEGGAFFIKIGKNKVNMQTLHKEFETMIKKKVKQNLNIRKKYNVKKPE